MDDATWTSCVSQFMRCCCAISSGKLRNPTLVYIWAKVGAGIVHPSWQKPRSQDPVSGLKSVHAESTHPSGTYGDGHQRPRHTSGRLQRRILPCYGRWIFRSLFTGQPLIWETQDVFDRKRTRSVGRLTVEGTEGHGGLLWVLSTLFTKVWNATDNRHGATPRCL